MLDPLLEQLRQADPDEFQRLYIKVKMEMVNGVGIKQDFVVNEGFDPDRNPFDIPIIINNFNRLACLEKMVFFLRDRGYHNLYILDNASSWPPLLDWYRNSGLRVFYIDQNIGYLALWKTGLKYRFNKQYYVYSDPDILPDPDCPHDFLAHFQELLIRFPQLEKVGFGLHIDDLPDHFSHRDAVIQHEQGFWREQLSESDNLFQARIDTTFALYRPRAQGGWWLPAARTGAPYMARHLPWYQNSLHPDEEELFYRASIMQSTHWTRMDS